jgi:hypothetical protein
MGREEFGKAVARFVERDNAVTLKRRLEARGETVRVERGIVHGLSEEETERRFSDYSRVQPRPYQEALKEPSGASESVVAEPGEGGSRSATGGAQEGAERVSWWRKVFEG